MWRSIWQILGWFRPKTNSERLALLEEAYADMSARVRKMEKWRAAHRP